MSATPQTLGPAGGNATISARVEDASGAGIPGVPVTFTSDTGTLSAGTAITDANGFATVTLNTSRQSKVTANVAGKTADVTVGLNPRTGITLAGPTTPVSAGVPATFTVDVGHHRERSRRGRRLRRWLATVARGAQWFDDDQPHLQRGRHLQRLGNRHRGERVHRNGVDRHHRAPGPAARSDRHGLGSNADREPDDYVHRNRQRRDVDDPVVPVGVRRRHDRRHHRATESRSRTARRGTKVVRVTVVQAVGPSGQSQTTVNVVAASSAGN